ncbi:hypothetical protein VE03_08788 [Pseudogymnoascus sp. 23342-1-I1]|nr:hypothetical protein VE03_08788 [Pseudogymnoascus sp. 23342-1-I1]
MEKFTVRRFDGSVVYIKNPMFGVLKSIWKPYVKLQEYWLLVRSKSDGPHETYLCTYLVDWVNESIRIYEGLIENARLLFNIKQQQWEASMTCEAFTSQLRKALGGDGNAKRVTKIVCFALGDLNFKPPDTRRIQNEALPEDERESDISAIDGALVHHAIALTMANVVRSCAKPDDKGVRLLTQDPGYCDETKDLLKDIGFEVVGGYGAGGFAEVDDESIVFSPFPKAPVQQIITGLARPLAFITLRGTTVWNRRAKPYADPESPRTRQMWERYESWDFPVSPDSKQLGGSLHQLKGHTRIGE